MLTDYKISRIVRGNGRTEVFARIYEGDLKSVTERNILTKQDETKIVYSRNKVLREVTLNLAGNVSDADIKQKLNRELAKDPSRTPIDQQKL